MAAKSPVPNDGKAQLDQAWAVTYEQAEKKFGEITKKYLKDFKDKDGKMLLRKEMKVEDLIAQVQAGKDVMVSTREGHQKWTSMLKKAMIPIETIGGLAAGITATVWCFQKGWSFIANHLIRHSQAHPAGWPTMRYLI